MNVLVIAPHPDDEVLGCGGLIAKRIASGDKVTVCIVTEGKTPMYSEEFIVSEEKEMNNAHNKLGVTSTIQMRLPSAMLDTIPRHEINDRISEIVKSVKPEEVYIPHRGDMHRDHQIVSEASMVALRPRIGNGVKRILAYETMSETDWNIPNAQNSFIPNVFEDITDFLAKKQEAMKCYVSQMHNNPSARSLQAIEGLAMHRGALVEVCYAEAFMLVREVRK